MKHLQQILLGAGLVGVPGILLGAGFSEWRMESSFSHPPAGVSTAHALREAARNDAQADFWTAAANCFNDTSANLLDCLRDARDERREALDEAEEQHDARLALLNALGDGPYDPPVNPADFSSNVTNSYLPLIPGRTLVYQKTTPQGIERLESTTLASTIAIAGVDCRRVHEVESMNGELVEDTEDWIAQHMNGDVVYFGEISLSYEDGFLESIDGSWRTGIEGAKPGVLMLAAPAVGALYRQEFMPGVAEDVGQVVATGVTITVAYGTFTNCVKTRDGSPIEPGNFEYKYYAPGVGLVAEEDPSTGEFLELIQIL